MPAPDPRAYLCLITFFLFLSIAIGGGCLIAYTLLPYPPAWLSYVGITCVCLPWLFWILTFVYRLLSRAFGFRMVIGSSSNTKGETQPHDLDPPGQNLETSPKGSAPKVQSGNALASSNGGYEGNKSKEQVSTSSDSSFTSHESEMPLAISMGA